MANTVRGERAERMSRLATIPFLLLHLAVGLVVLAGFSWKLALLALASYYLRMFFVTAGYHRYFSHRTFKTSRAFQFVLAFMAETSAQKGVLWWAANHRHHHVSSDTPEDIHSPLQRGFWWSHVGWILSSRYEETDFDRVKDLARYPELRFLNKFHLLPTILYAVGMYLAFGFAGFVWGYVISTVVLYHGTFFINSLAHVFGRRRYETTDTSRNSMLLALLTLGEGWHNNHHHYQSATNQGFYWYEVDGTYYGLKVLSWLHIISDVRTPPPRILEAGRTRRATKKLSLPAPTLAVQPDPS